MAFEGLSDKLNNVFKKLRSKGRLTESDVREAMREVRLALLEADVNFKVVKDFVKTVTDKAIGTDILESLTPAQQVVKLVNDELCALMGGSQSRVHMANRPPTVIMFVGLQGAGKTTNIAKLAGWFKKKEGRRPLLCACDVYRPAAVQQLKVVGGQLDIPVYEEGQGDPIAIAQHAFDHARQHGNDLLLLDTAGRLHIDEALMDELKNIKAAVKPHEIMLVVDGMTGQDAVNAASAFDEALGIDSVLMTKLDGDARGGAALSIRAVTGKPIKFVGMGDVLTLVEKAQDAFDEKQAAALEKKLRAGKMTLTDFLEQLRQIKNMGNIQDVMGMLPGMDKKALANAKVDEKAFARLEAIILSMTEKERSNPEIIKYSRKKRIAAGCGLKIEDVNRLLKQFDQMQRMMKQFSSPGAVKKMKRSGFKFPY